ncbi:MAG: hypothetical protein EGR00_08510 [Prevotella sp.]|nr:hypothetical protein [Prevotella sp.]
MGLSAQSYGSETVSEAGEGQYLLYNVGAQKYLCPGNAWGTHASLGKVGMMVKLMPQGDGTYHVSTKPYYNEDKFLSDGAWTDNNAAPYSFEKVEGAEEPTYKLVCKSNTLYWSGKGTDLSFDANGPAAGSEANGQWRLIKIGTEDATEEKPQDVSYLITNPDFDIRGNQNGLGALKGWVGEPAPNNSCAERFNMNFDVYQVKTGLPNGKYRVSCQGFYRAGGHDSGNETQNAFLYANDNVTPLLNILAEKDNFSAEYVGEKNESGEPNTMGEAQNYFSAGFYKNNSVEVTVVNGTLRFGIKKSEQIAADWTIFDTFRLEYLGEVDLNAAAVAEFKVLKDEGNALLQENSDMAETEEYKVLQNVIAKTATAENLAELKAEYYSAKNAFVDLKVSYEAWDAAYAAEKTVLEGLGIADQFATRPKTAAEAAKGAQTMNVAEYEAVVKDYTTDIKLGDWITSGAANFNNEHWSGTKSNYLNQIDGVKQGYNADSWKMSASQEITLPAGEYVFKAAGRKSADATMTLSVRNGETSLGKVVNFPSGNRGRGITKDGKASFEEGSFACYNNQTKKEEGYGWQWRFVPFTLTEKTTITISIEAGANLIHNWASFGDYSVMAKPNTAASEVAYNQAIEAANAALANEANQVVTGEEKASLNAAIAIDKGTTVESIDAATAAVKAATETYVAAVASYQALADAKTMKLNFAYASAEKKAAFAEALQVEAATSAKDATDKTNAIYTAARAYAESNGKAEGVKGAVDCTASVENANFADQLNGWSSSQNDGLLQTLSNEPWTTSEGVTGTPYYDYYNGDANNQHAYQNVSELQAGKYIVTIKARALAGFNLYMLINDEKKVDINEIGNTGGLFGRGWNDYTAEFEVGNDGMVKLEVANMPAQNQAGWFGFGDVRLFKVGDLDAVTLNEDKTCDPEVKVANVTLNRTLTKHWNSIVLPFAVSKEQIAAQFGEGTVVAAYKNATIDETSTTLNFDVVEEMQANVPYLIKPAQAGYTYTFEGVAIKPADNLEAGEGEIKFVGNYENGKQLAEGDYFIDAKRNQFYSANGTETMKAFRAIFVSTAAAPAKAMFFSIRGNSGETTGIEDVKTLAGKTFDVYSIDGMLVRKNATSLSGLAKGVYVVNGKKYIAK